MEGSEVGERLDGLTRPPVPAPIARQRHVGLRWRKDLAVNRAALVVRGAGRRGPVRKLRMAGLRARPAHAVGLGRALEADSVGLELQLL